MIEVKKMHYCEEHDRWFEGDPQWRGHRSRCHSERRVQVLKPIGHGTPNGARAHRRRKEQTCAACKMAWRIYIRRHRAQNG